jgi:hypothetical protein
LTGTAVNVTDVPEQIAPEGEDVMLTLAGRFGLTTMVTALEVAGLPDLHVSEELISTVITSPFAKTDEVYVLPVAPAIFTPPFFHWKVGVVPPLTGVAVKVTDVPAQMTPAGKAAMVTLAGRFGFTIIATVLEVAGLPVAHVASDVRMQVT